MSSASLFTRRQVLAGGSAMLAAGAFAPRWAFAASTPLPVPPLADGTGGNTLDMRIQTGSRAFLPGLQTPTLGFNQNYLGPTIRTRRGTELSLRYENTLDEPVAVHGHGLHVPGAVDGGPQLSMPPGEVWAPTLEIVQPASTTWYHSHAHGYTGSQVYRGLAGMIIIDDDESDALGLPNQYGVDDFPIIMQDRTFDANGRLVYSLADTGEDGWLGETAIINGAVSSVARVPAGKVRLRLLNGANARFFIVVFADKRPFHMVASDGGLLEKPIELTSLEMAPGERCEIIVDCADGQVAGLLTLFEDDYEEPEGLLGGLMNAIRGETPLPPPHLTLQVDPSLPANTRALPDTLATITRPKAADVVRTRDFVLAMDHEGSTVHGGHHGPMDMTINGAVMDMSVINERVKLGEWERWRVASDPGMHPFHVHGCSFLVDTIEGEAAPAHLRGWKDTVVVDDEGWTEFLVRFDYTATEAHPYMYHCHILEHEDRGMMGQFTVT